MSRLYSLLLLITLLPHQLLSQSETKEIQVAFLADVHLQDLYGTFSDTDYKGIINAVNGKNVLLRTMDSQLHSTRIFNENYFAFLTALDDIAKRNIKLVALPGDYTDDGQPIHLRGLQRILNEYAQKYGIEFFITTGNHDPVGPFAQPSGKDDFLGEGGKPQPIFSNEGMYKPKRNELPVVVTKDIAKMGYEDITRYLNNFGFFPKPNYIYWETPFSNYSPDNYLYENAQNKSSLSYRVYDVAPGYSVPDVSYLTEPVEGLWLLAIDGNVYIPKANSNGDGKNPKNYSGADLGYNNVLSHKKHLVSWVKKVADEAKKRGKTLIAFSHYPMVEFNDDASAEIESLMGKGKWQLNRIPEEEVAQTFADAGIQIHFGGHMHINDTGVRTTKNGNTIVNIQTPSLAAYIPAYKLLTIEKGNIAEIETITIDNVPRFNELFDLYAIEHKHLKSINSTEIWDDAILKTKSYHEFTDYHLKELVRLRFMPDDWPLEFREFLSEISGYDLLILANRNSESIENFIKDKSSDEWKNAAKKAENLLKKNRLKLEDFKEWKGIDLIIDFYRIRSADRLAISDIGTDRIKQYKIISDCILKKKQSTDMTQYSLSLFFSILDKFLNGAPAGHFTVNFKTGEVINLDNK
ncbi:metallophosphatase [Flavobacterium psychrophilum]|nr:metallophosphatase [Flavobacterium psychrophilum]AOE51118.1 metallophosphatase [Flavobacterium psychrophilum]